MKLTGYACNSLANFKYVLCATTGNGNLVNLLKLAWKMKSHQLNLFWRVLPIWNHCTRAAAGGLYGIAGLASKGQVVVDLPAPLPTCGVFALYSIS